MKSNSGGRVDTHNEGKLKGKELSAQQSNPGREPVARIFQMLRLIVSAELDCVSWQEDHAASTSFHLDGAAHAGEGGGGGM